MWSQLLNLPRELNVLWDGGSTISLITFSPRRKELGLKGEAETVFFRTYGIDKVSTNLKHVDLAVVVKLFQGIN